MISNEIKDEIRAIVGEENVLDSNLDLFSYSYDSSFVPLLPANKPHLAVRPLTTEEVSAVMKIAYEHEIIVVQPQIIELDERNMMINTEPGVRTIDLYNYCAAKGLFYPPDPAGWKFSTIGGNVAENAGGMRAVK